MKLLLITIALLMLWLIWYIIRRIRARKRKDALIYPDFQTRVLGKSLYQYNPESGKTEFVNGSSIHFPESPVQNHGVNYHYPSPSWSHIIPPSILDSPLSWPSNDSPITDNSGGDFGGGGAGNDY